MDAKTAPQGVTIAREFTLHASILDIFDFRYYFYANSQVRGDLDKPDQHRCLTHFCLHGVDAALPFNEAYLFEAEFYNDTYLGYQVGVKNAYRHWINVGFRKKWHPNRESWLKEKIGCDARTFDGFDFELCKTYFYGSQSDARWVDLFTRFIELDIFSAGPHLPIAEEAADFFTTVADQFANRGRDTEAANIYEQVLVSFPDHRRALLNYGACLQRQKRFLQAHTIYGLLLTKNESSISCILNLAACYEELSEAWKALAWLRTGMDRFPGEPQFRLRFETLANQLLMEEWHFALSIGELGRYREAQERLQQACERLSSMMTPRERLPRGPIRSIAIIGNVDMPQCTLYRIEQKLEQLRAAGYEVVLFDVRSDPRGFRGQIYKFDAVIFYRVPATVPVISLINHSEEMGLTTFYEINDMIFAGEDYPGTFQSFLGQISIKEYVALKLGVPLFRHAISLCDYGIASTPALAREMASVLPSGQAFVHRNAFGNKHQRLSMRPSTTRAGDRVTIFYGSGTKSHKEDFRELVEPALVELVRRYGERVNIVLVGFTVTSAALQGIDKNLIVLDPIWDIEQYWSIMCEADINIAVLKKDRMTDCKSELKWMEAAMFGIPSVVSGTATYVEVIEPGVTGIICNSTEDWVAALDLLVRDAALRRRIGLAAWQRVRDAYNIPLMGKNLASIFARTVPVTTSTTKPTVVIVNVFYPPQATGGATRVVDDNVKHLAEICRDDFRIEVFTSGWVPEEQDDDVLFCYVQGGVRVTSVLRRTAADIELAVVDSKMAEIFAEYLDRVKPALIHFHCIQRLTASVVSAALARGIPYVITPHDGWWISDVQFIVNTADQPVLYDYADPAATSRQWGASAYARMMQLKAPLFGARKVLAVSEKFADLYRSCGVPNVVTVENGMSEIEPRSRTPARDGRVRLGFLGGIGHPKGSDIIKYALLGREFEHLRLIVIDGSLQPGSSRQEMWNTTPVEFRPKVPEDRVAELYADIDVLLAPSVCIESFGLVTREALHCGCWVVASDRGSIGDCVTDGENGYVIDVSDASELIRVFTLIDGAPQRYREVPPSRPVLRRSSEQAAELAELYKSIIATIDGGASCAEAGMVDAAALVLGSR